MSNASDDDSGTDEDLAEIRERKKEQLRSAAETPAEPVRVTDREDFESLTQGPGVVLVDFYADWCGPCKMLEPVVETVAETTPATVLEVDVDEHQDLAREYQVQGVPTLLYFADGELAERQVGVQDESEIEKTIEEYATD